MEGLTRTKPPLSELVALVLSSTLRSRNSCSMAEFRIECLTYAHSRARPVLSLTSSGYGLPRTITIPVRRLINIKRPSRLEPADFSSRDVCSHRTESNALPTELRDRLVYSKTFSHWLLHRVTNATKTNAYEVSLLDIVLELIFGALIQTTVRKSLKSCHFRIITSHLMQIYRSP